LKAELRIIRVDEAVVNTDSSFVLRAIVDEQLSTFSLRNLSELIALLPALNMRHSEYAQRTKHEWHMDLSHYIGIGYSLELDRDSSSMLMVLVSDFGWQLIRLRPTPIKVYPKPKFHKTQHVVAFTPPEWEVSCLANFGQSSC
jgi:hypothetical protein